MATLLKGNMKISVVGIWHLGMTYSIGLAELGHKVIGIDPNLQTIEKLNSGKLSVYEPKLTDLLRSNLASNNLKFSSLYEDCAGSQVIFVTFDTPVNEEDLGDADFVFNEINNLLPFIEQNSLLIICSQLPVGSCEKILKMTQGIKKAIEIIAHPENLRLGKAFETFFYPDRLIFGTFDGSPNELVEKVFHKIDKPKIWMKTNSAEMSKHALNTFLALSVAFAGELAQICSNFGADAKEVEQALKSDQRIGPKAYLSPGLGFSGGTLAREVNTLVRLQESIGRELSILSLILESNKINNLWVEQTLRKILPVKNERIVFCGVSYVQGTDTLRRSITIEAMSRLLSDGYDIFFIEDEFFNNSESLGFKYFLMESQMKIDALVIMKNLRVFETKKELLSKIISQSTWIIDPFRILKDRMSGHNETEKYLSIGTGKWNPI